MNQRLVPETRIVPRSNGNGMMNLIMSVLIPASAGRTLPLKRRCTASRPIRVESNSISLVALNLTAADLLPDAIQLAVLEHDHCAIAGAGGTVDRAMFQRQSCAIDSNDSTIERAIY